MRVAVITGGCSGIGQKVAEKFLENKWKVVVLDREQNSSNIIDNYTYLKTELKDERAIEKSFNIISGEFSEINALVNCAGIIEDEISLTDLNKKKFEEVISVNLTAVFLTCKYCLPLLRHSSDSSIINIGSISGTKKNSKYLAYSASKAGLVSLSFSLAKQLAKNKIRVNIVSPGSVINTGFSGRYSKNKLSFKDKIQLIKQSPMAEIITPESIADIVYFLTSYESRHITGANIIVDAGISL
ncbi:SDR family oxidoreductase [Proteinivorax tanatarense]|uniref:SDR family oxidoreductase n=1 Tax=Proteinivorax tanatarense TaxID=1260629 RepID=A0AAU7VK10_9FIRM